MAMRVETNPFETAYAGFLLTCLAWVFLLFGGALRAQEQALIVQPLFCKFQRRRT
jgi:hypothetical protein